MGYTEFVMLTLGILGRRGRDKVTGFEGVISSVAFDLYGCVAAVVNPGVDKDGKMQDSLYFDVQRLQIEQADPVMPAPDYSDYLKTLADHKKGPAEKPAAGH